MSGRAVTWRAALLGRRQAPLAALIAAMLLGANLSTWALQHRLGDARIVALRDEPSWATYWPSGHTTAAVAIGAAVVMVSTPRWRPFAAGASLLVTSVAVLTNLALRIHVPTDVLGGIGVAATWAFLAFAAQLRWPRLRPR
jgi:membrane-associated phospholipid phosphatase